VYTASVFIGCSISAGLVGTAVKAVLLEQATIADRVSMDVDVWTTTFGIGATTYGSVLQASRSYDFGIFVFAPDAKIVSEEGGRAAPRDNVVYELGLFTGALGEDRVFVMAPANVQVQIPSDLAGVIYAPYDALAPADKADNNRLRSAVDTACLAIMSKILEVCDRQESPELSPQLGIGAELLLTELQVDLRRGELVELAAAELRHGLAVMHHKHGLGSVDAWDAGETRAPDTLVRARFGGRMQLVLARELFLPHRISREQ
jgi:hypothetical protein